MEGGDEGEAKAGTGWIGERWMGGWSSGGVGGKEGEGNGEVNFIL